MNAQTQTRTSSLNARHSGAGRNPVVETITFPLRGNDLRVRHAKAPTFRLTPLTALIQATLLGLPAAALAGPEGGVVAAGTGTIARPDAQTTNIHQSSQNLILNWDSYNIRANETVNYRQPNAQAQALNRIHSQNPSHIYGQLNANGQVLLVNPNGVFFKPGARVNVGGLVASGLNITDKDFLAGKYHFKHAGKTPPGAVVNQGVIQAATGGSVSLLGGAVRNEGRILAHAGQVNLVAGKALAMDFDGDGLMRFTVSEALLKKTGGLDQAVSNTGTIEAEGGAVLLQGRAARDVFSEVVNNSGVIGAAKVDNTGGVIRLVAAGQGNSLINTGTLQAAGGAIELKAEGRAEVSGKARISTASKTGQGGQIEITGNKVGLLGEARLDASGATGGGQILAGGDYQGRNPAIKNAQVTYIGKDAKLAADATQQGKGGRVIVWADDTTRYHGAISAKGGPAGGDGGFVEVSGKRHLAFRGKVDVSAPRGRAGTLLLDPNNLCIGGNTTCGISTPEDTGTDSIFDAASSEQDSWVSEATLKNIGNADIILQADNNIYFDGNINLGTSYTSDFRLLAGSSIDMQRKSLTLPNGTARFYAGSTVVEKSGEFTTTIERSGSITLGPVTARTLYLSAGNVNAEGTLTVTNLRLNEDRPPRTDISTGIFASSRGYTGQYTITTGGTSNAITKLYVGGTLGDKLHLITLEGYEIASPIKTGAKTILTFELRGADHAHAKGAGADAGAGDHHDDDLTITQAEGAVISGPGKLVKGGTGTLELGQANTYSGDTELSGGTLRITHADGLGTPAEKEGKTPASKTTLSSAGATLELDGHAGQLEINASESLILNGGILRNESGANTWHGPVTLGKASTIDSEAGALTIKSALNLQSGTGSALEAEDLQIIGAGDVRLTGVISGKGGIIKGRAGTAGAGDTGTLTLAGDNTYTGRTIIHRGVLRIQHNNALGTGAGSLGTTVNTNGALELYATGTASLNIGNEALTLAGGTLKNARGDNTWNGNISLTAAATIDSRTRVVKFTRDGIEGEIHYQQTLTLAGNISGAHNLTFTGGGHSDMRGQIQTGAGGLSKTGAGTLTLNNSNTYTGDTTVRGGTLALGGTRFNALDPTGDLIVENTTLNNNGTPDDPTDDTVLPAVFALGQANQTFANVTLRSGQITRTPGAPATRGVLTVSNSGQIQAQRGAISANLAGGAALTKTTAGRLTLSGDNRGYTGAVTIRAGILRLFGGHALDDEAEVSLNNATDNNTARLEIATSQTLGSLTGRGEVYIGAGQTLTLNIGAGKSASYAGVISGAASLSRTLFRGGRLVTETIRGGLTKAGAGRLTLTSANTFGGQTRINQGDLRIEHLLALQNTAVHLADAANTQLTIATASLRKESTRIGSLSGGAAADATGAARDNGKIVIFKGQVLAINQITDGVYSGRITQEDPVPLPEIFKRYPSLKPRSADLIKTGPARITLSGKNTYTGFTIINEGTLAIGQDDAINAASSLIVGQAPDFDFAKVRLIDPVPGVFDLGRHKQTLSSVRLNAGAINRSGATRPDQGVLTVNSLRRADGSPLIGFTLMSGTVNAILAGQTSLVKDNPSVELIINRRAYKLYIERSVTLNAANTYSGKTTISRGTLRITNAGALGTAANDDATGTTIEPGGFLRFGRFGYESGTSWHGGGTLELDLGDGNHRIDNENLILAGRGAFDTENLDITRETVARYIFGLFDAKGALRNVSGNNTWGGAVELESNATIQNDSGDPSAAAPSLRLSGDLSLTHDEDERADLTVTGRGRTLLSGRIRGLGGLIKQGAGRLTLTGANTFSGQTRINQGELRIEHLLALQNTAVHLADAANTQLTVATKSLPWSRARVTRIGSLSGGGKIVIFKDQVLAINQTTDGIYSGRIMEQDPVPLPQIYRIYTFLKPRPAVLIKTGAAGLTLSGKNTYTGLTIINQGTLAIGQNDAIHSASALIVGQPPGFNSVNIRLIDPVEGVFDLGRYNQTLSGVELNAGAINRTGASGPDQGVLTVKSRSGFTLTLKSGTVNAILAGQTSLVKENPFVRVRIGWRRFPIYIESAVTLNAANTYSGQTRINKGTLRITNPGALGSANNDDATGTTIEPGRSRRLPIARFGFTRHGGGTLELDLGAGNHSIANENLILAGRGAFDTKDSNITRRTLAQHVRGEFDARGALRNVSGNNTWGGAVRLASNSTISGMGSLTFGGAIDATRAGGQDLTLDGALIARFSGPVGGTRPLRNLTVNGARQIILTGALTLTGRATFSNITGVEETGMRVAIKMREGEGSPGALTAPALLLRGITGRSQLRGDVDTLAADNIGEFSFMDSDELTVGTVGGVSGIATRNPLTLNAGGDLQSGPAGEAIAASGTLTLAARGIGRADTPLNLNFTGMTEGSLDLTTRGQGAAGNIYVRNAGDLKTSTLNLDTDDLTAQTARFASGGVIEVDDADGGASNLDANDTLILDGVVRLTGDVRANNPAFTFTGPVTAMADRVVNTGRGALTFRTTIDAGANRLTLTAGRLTLTDDVTAGALDMRGAGQLVIAGNSPTLYVNPANLSFPTLMTGGGALTIPGIRGQALDVGEDFKLPTNMRGYQGHLIIGGLLTPEGAMPYYSRGVTDIQAHVPRLTVSRAIATGGPVTLLAGDLDLNADIQTGGQLGLVAVGPNQPGLMGSTGAIRAGAGRVRLTVPPEGVATGRPAAAIIAVGGFRNAFNINLALDRREVDVASGRGAVGFDPGSLITDRATDSDFRAFVSRLGGVLGTSRPLGLQLAQAFVFNPAARLTGAEALTFIDLSLFGQELTLFGAIGTGIALSLSQCEEQYGCAPNVTLEELDTLIAQLSARIAELERRRGEADEADHATIDVQLADYRAERQNFEAYRETFKRYILAEEAADDLPGLPEAGDTDEVARLTRALQGVRARIQWLEGLRGDAAKRERLARATGQDLTPERLEVIIEAAKAQATFIENRIRLLLEGTEAGLPEAPRFRAEAGDYEAVDVVQYRASLGALTLPGERGWY